MVMMEMGRKNIEVFVRKEAGDGTLPIIKKQIAGLSLHQESTMLNKCHGYIFLHLISPPPGLKAASDGM
jgi:hypothetical protein